MKENRALNVQIICPKKTKVIDNWLTLNNVPESAKIEIYSSTGVLIAVENSYTSGQSIPLYEKGIYVCVVNDGTRKEIVKIVY